MSGRTQLPKEQVLGKAHWVIARKKHPCSACWGYLVKGEECIQVRSKFFYHQSCFYEEYNYTPRRTSKAVKQYRIIKDKIEKTIDRGDVVEGYDVLEEVEGKERFNTFKRVYTTYRLIILALNSRGVK